ncbi:MAG: type II toxin-antitoxin system RelE family toxin [Pseudonocardiaceae bacterium]
MTEYRVELRPAAAKALHTLEPGVQQRIRGVIAWLAHDPRPPNAKALPGRRGLRVRVGDYRVIYTVADDVLLVVGVSLGHRREIYDR